MRQAGTPGNPPPPRPRAVSECCFQLFPLLHCTKKSAVEVHVAQVRRGLRVPRRARETAPFRRLREVPINTTAFLIARLIALPVAEQAFRLP